MGPGTQNVSSFEKTNIIFRSGKTVSFSILISLVPLVVIEINL